LVKINKETAMTRTKALTDLVILLVVLGSVWSLRFFGVQYVGVLTTSAGMVVIAILLRWRRQALSDIGWRFVFRGHQLWSRTLEVMGVTALTMIVGMLLIGTIFGEPDQSAAVSQLPDNIWLFLLDVTILTWVFIAFGEELIFRGMMLSRLEILFGLKGRANLAAVSLAQGLLFGAGHASQGATGMIITGAIGTALGLYFMTRGQRSLIPLVLSHGIIDTTVLSASWLGRMFGG
jgi:membrane protease YdiL (CAAX protease family)